MSEAKPAYLELLGELETLAKAMSDDKEADKKIQAAADAGHGVQERIVAAGQLPGGGEEFAFEPQQHFIIGADHVQVDLQRALVQWIVILREQALFPRVAIRAALFDRRVAFGQLVALDAGQQLGAAPDVEEALAQ